MKEVINFLQSFFEEEVRAHENYRKKDNMFTYNEQFKKLDSFTINSDTNIEAKIGLGLSKMSYDHDELFFEDVEFLPNIKARTLFKITSYENSNYGILYACYVSLPNSDSDKTKLISKCLLVTKTEFSYKIIGIYFPDYDSGKWKFGGGNSKYKDFYSLGSVTNIERITPPLNDEWSLEEYNANR